jgi:hypothetical protein
VLMGMHGEMNSSAHVRWGRPDIIACLGLSLFCLFFLIFTAQNQTEAEDAIYYATSVRAGSPDVHPNHLLFEPLNFVFWQATRALGLIPDARFAMQALSALAGGAGVLLVYGLSRQVALPRSLAILAAAFLGCSYGFATYSTVADTYVLPIPFAVGSIWALTVARTPGGFALSGALIGVATLIHQQYAFGCVALFLAATMLQWTAVKRANWRALAGGLGMFSAAAAGVVALGYGAVGAFVLGHADLGETLEWSRGLSRDGLWSPPSLRTPILAVVGFVRAVLGINVLFAVDATYGIVQGVWPGRLFDEERFLAQSYLAGAPMWFIAAAIVAAVGATCVLVWRFWKDRRVAAASDDPFRRRLVVIALCWLTVMAFAVSIWEADNPEFWIGLVPVVAVLLAIGADRLAPRVRAPLFPLVAALGVFNALSGPIPYADAGTDYYLDRYAAVLKELQPNDVIITNCGYICGGYIQYHTPALVVAPNIRGAAGVVSALEPSASSAGRVFLLEVAPEAFSGDDAAGPVIRAEAEALLRNAREVSVAVPGMDPVLLRVR